MNKYFQSTGYGSNTADSGLIVEFDGYTKGVVVRADNAGIYEVGHSSLTWVPHTLAEYWTEVEWPVEEEFAMNNKTQLQLLLEATVAPLEDRMKAVYVDKDGQIEYWFNGDVIDNSDILAITPAIRFIVDTYLEGGWEINYGEAPNYGLVDALFADYMIATRVPPPTHNWDITSNACVIIYREHKPDIKTSSQEEEKEFERMESHKDENLKPSPKPSPYHILINGKWIDCYELIKALDITNPAQAHAFKKIAYAGQRGHKDWIKDMNEASWSCNRAVELED